MDYVLSITSMLFGAGLFSFVQFLINRKDIAKAKQDEKNDMLQQVMSLLQKVEMDSVRSNLLILMNFYPDRRDKIMAVAEHYFKDLKGNWFVTDIFKDWLKKEEIDQPDWIK